MSADMKPAALIAARLAGKAPPEPDEEPGMPSDPAADAPNMGLHAAASELIAALGGPHGADVNKVMAALKNAMDCAEQDEGPSEEPQQ